MDKKLKELKKQYKNVPIPDELNEVVEKALHRNKKKSPYPKWILGSVAAASIMFTATINTSPAFAKNMAQIPILSNFVEVLTFTKIEEKNGTYETKIEIPQITGDSEEIAALNAKYKEEGLALYDQYVQFSNEMEDGHHALESGYTIVTENEQLLSVGRYVVEIVGSSSTVMEYTTIDKAQQIAITLPSLFKDERYIDIISAYIADEMQREMADSNGEKVYWVESDSEEPVFDSFQKIRKDQNFYISNEGKLVIAFQKYEVAPGYMGLVQFEIPTEIIQDVLVSNIYIK
ncbi:DUF3298 domain-containing protein [Solibacillus silvestris]|uniref:DUF3298 and DUF4163 domain-containing protein n=1 Tax=Solibacillus silvestris TaxID=76853 RepID=UPI003F7EDDDD